MNTRPRLFTTYSARLGLLLLIILLIVMMIFVSNWYLTARERAEQDFHASEVTIDKILQQSTLWIDRGMYLYDLTSEPPLRSAMQILQDENNATGGDPDHLDLQQVKTEIEEQLGDEYQIYLIENGVVTHTTDPKDFGLNFSTFAPELIPKLNKIQESGTFVLDRSVRGYESDVPVRLFAYQSNPDHTYLFEVGRIFEHYLPEENQAYYTDLVKILWTLNPDIVSFDLYNSFDVLIANRSEISLPNTDNLTLQHIHQTFTDEAGFTEHDPEHHWDIVYTHLPVLQTDAPSTKWMNVASRTVYSTARLDNELTMITLMYIGFLIITLIIALISAFTISRYLTRPLHFMLEDIDAITGGDLSHQVRSSPHHELSRISGAINQMVTEMVIHIQALKNSESRYRSLFTSSGDAILILEKTRVIDANPEAIQLFNLESGYQGLEVSVVLGSLGNTISTMVLKNIPAHSTHRFVEETNVQSDNARSDNARSDNARSEQYLSIRITQVNTGDTILNQVQVRDVTEHQLASLAFAQQESLKAAYRQIENILEMLPDPTFVIDQHGKVLFWNRAYGGGEPDPCI